MRRSSRTIDRISWHSCSSDPPAVGPNWPLFWPPTIPTSDFLRDWSRQEYLTRAIAGTIEQCSLYERPALCHNKEEIRRFAYQVLVVEKVADCSKILLVIESVMIDRIEIFLLELNNRFLFEFWQKSALFFQRPLLPWSGLLQPAPMRIYPDLKRNKLLTGFGRDADACKLLILYGAMTYCAPSVSS